MKSDNEKELICVIEKILRAIDSDVFQELCEKVNKCLKEEKKYTFRSLATVIQKYGSPFAETFIKEIDNYRSVLLVYGRNILSIKGKVKEMKEKADRWGISEKNYLKGICEKELRECFK